MKDKDTKLLEEAYFDVSKFDDNFAFQKKKNLVGSKSDIDALKLIYQWVKQDDITMKQFIALIGEKFYKGL